MIKRYLNFINENKFGDHVEKHMKNEDIRRMITPFLDGYEKDLNISNIIELLDEDTKEEIRGIIDNYLENGLSPKENIKTTTIAHIEESSGKGVFTTFLKALTALNKKLNKKEKENYLLYLETEEVDFNLINVIFNRFKSLSFYLNDIKETQKNITMFYGIKDNINIEYGLNIENKTYLFGYFRLSKSSYSWLLNLNLKSSILLKEELNHLSYEQIRTFSFAKKDIKNIPIFDYKKIIEPMIKNGILKWGYYGIGTWKNGNIDELELDNYKNLIKKWIVNNKWGDVVLYKIYANDFWLIIELKNK